MYTLNLHLIWAKYFSGELLEASVEKWVAGARGGQLEVLNCKSRQVRVARYVCASGLDLGGALLKTPGSASSLLCSYLYPHGKVGCHRSQRKNVNDPTSAFCLTRLVCFLSLLPPWI